MLLVTGGAGYVGSHFLHSYRRRGGGEIVVLDNLCEGHEKAIAGDKVHLVQASIGDQAALDKLFQEYKIDTVVHFAACAYVGESQEVPFKYLQNNVCQTINLFEAMERHGVRKVVFSSTCSTYGIPEYVPIDEKHPQRPVNVYGNTKLIVERILHSLAETKKWSYVALRYFNAAGAAEDGTIGESHDPETHLIPLILKAAKGDNQFVSIHGDDYDTRDGTCIRDYIHVTDLGDAHCQAVELLGVERATECINLGTEHGASVKEVINVCSEIAGSEIPVRIGPRRSGDPAVLVADASRAGAVLKWQPKYDLKSIVQTAWNWEQHRRY
ncbi:MAG: UDP-glucose 4-epimerase GalE [Terriglobales bacterium]